VRAAVPDWSLTEIEDLAIQWWRELPHGGVLWLSGELGAGKTTFVQAICRAARAEPARSPTFALVHEYDSPEGPLVHVDCYRLKQPDEASDLDLDALAARSRLLLIEWPERAGAWAPAPTVHLRLGYAADPARRTVEQLQ
jgi:tRNA threonylcarbamoyladenosine biosynthesis protein TsaE